MYPSHKFLKLAKCHRLFTWSHWSDFAMLGSKSNTVMLLYTYLCPIKKAVLIVRRLEELSLVIWPRGALINQSYERHWICIWQMKSGLCDPELNRACHLAVIVRATILVPHQHFETTAVQVKLYTCRWKLPVPDLQITAVIWLRVRTQE